MDSQKRKLISQDGTVYILTGEYYGEGSKPDENRRGPYEVELLQRAEGNAWILEQMTVKKNEIVSKKFRRIKDEEAKQILIKLGEADALLKYGLGKLHEEDTDPESGEDADPESGEDADPESGEDADPESGEDADPKFKEDEFKELKEKEPHGGEGVVEDKQIQRVPVKLIVKLGQVRDELVQLAARKDNDPEQRGILEDCIKEISAIEKLLECDKLNPWWRPVIAKALQHIQNVLLDVGARVLADKVSELLNDLF